MISVVVPAYNASQYIGEAIGSVLQQGPLLRELIIVDDASTDDTASIVASFDDPRIKLLSRKQSAKGGVSAVRNDGLAASEGEWLLFLDADDMLRPNALNTMFEETKEGDFAAVYGDYQRIDMNGRSVGFRTFFNKRQKPSGDIFRRLLEGNFIVNGGVILIRKSAFQAVDGFSESIRYCEDWVAWCRLAFNNSIKYLPGACVLEYRVHQDSTMMKTRLCFEDCLPAIEALFSDPLVLAQVTPADLNRSRRKVESHMRSYVCAQDIRSRRYLPAFKEAFENLRRYPLGARKTLMSLGAAIVGF